jgi:hypothetical protein
MTRVLIADDHSILRGGLKELLVRHLEDVVCGKLRMRSKHLRHCSKYISGELAAARVPGMLSLRQAGWRSRTRRGQMSSRKLRAGRGLERMACWLPRAHSIPAKKWQFRCTQNVRFWRGGAQARTHTCQRCGVTNRRARRGACEKTLGAGAAR